MSMPVGTGMQSQATPLFNRPIRGLILKINGYNKTKL